MRPVPFLSPAAAAEAERILAEYDRRASVLPPGFYGWDRPANLFHHTETVRACVRALVRERLFPLQDKRVLDVGCGRGRWLLEMAQWGAYARDLHGCDLNPAFVEEARLRLPGADIHTADAGALPWPDQSFDCVTQFTVFTSILAPPVRRAIAREMLRVLKPGGLILWYDFRFNNPRNPNVRGIEAAEIRELFPQTAVTLDKVTLAPPLARAVVPWSWQLGLLLSALPFLRTHYLAVVKPRASSPGPASTRDSEFLDSNPIRSAPRSSGGT
jgi:SAM-dependent methyltransferase